ncbi:TPA: hypothetical protein KEY68_001494 [Providencia rettgeri]|uniref:hypothetical protein n=1 Tax=Providencia TaxID=586 RepID=UPI001B91AEB2|nr:MULTISPECIES: hypothetical protein [Providencia]EMB5786445.1 hypothetical protein [Providencia rettgeri]MDK7745714.1 hypothetical protein [Providencia rettgeri]MDK7758160.1 hypothetical protein [Providencia rettgeri]HBC7429240.1 hypothetical protein [Providencia rettgeri]
MNLYADNRIYLPGTMAIINMTGDRKKIKRVKIEYYNDRMVGKTLIVDNPEPLKVVGHTKFTYTDSHISFDYWQISVEWTWSNSDVIITSKGKNNFYCNISPNDNGLVLISLHLDPTELGTINEDNYARVFFSNSLGCYESLIN